MSVVELRGVSSVATWRGVTGPGGRRPTVALDGVRGIGCLLVILLHSWAIVPLSEIDKTGPLLGLFRSGSLGVTLFFVLGGFLVTRRLLDEIDRDGSFRVDRFWMRRLVRLGSQLSPLLIVMLVVSWFDRWDSWTSDQNQRSLLTAGTFTLNWSLVNDLGGHREDVGHLWYLSVEQQFYVAWVFVLAWFGRFRGLLIAAVAAAVAGVYVWRLHVLDVAGGGVAGLRTTTRVDGLLLGALAALTLPHLQRFAKAGAAITMPCLVALAVLVLASPELDRYAFLEAQGIAFALVATVLLVGIVVGDRPGGLAERLLALPPFVLLGRVSFPLYLWHLPIFWSSSRWARGIDWPIRAAASMIALAVIVYVMHRFVEQPVVRWLDHVREPGTRPDVRMVPAS